MEASTDSWAEVLAVLLDPWREICGCCSEFALEGAQREEGFTAPGVEVEYEYEYGGASGPVSELRPRLRWNANK